MTNPDTKLIVNGTIKAVVPQLGGITAVSVCWDFIFQILVQCVIPSNIRYKKDVETLSGGLDLVSRLRPVTFNWKHNGVKELGLIAEEVAKEEPLLANYDKDGRLQGVKYDRFGVVAITAIKEQQAQIEAQEKKITEQGELIKKLRSDLDALKAILCSQDRPTPSCKPQN